MIHFEVSRFRGRGPMVDDLSCTLIGKCKLPELFFVRLPLGQMLLLSAYATCSEFVRHRILFRSSVAGTTSIVAYVPHGFEVSSDRFVIMLCDCAIFTVRSMGEGGAMSRSEGGGLPQSCNRSRIGTISECRLDRSSSYLIRPAHISQEPGR